MFQYPPSDSAWVGMCLGKEREKLDKPLVVTPPGVLSQFDQFAA